MRAGLFCHKCRLCVIMSEVSTVLWLVHTCSTNLEMSYKNAQLKNSKLKKNKSARGFSSRLKKRSGNKLQSCNKDLKPYEFCNLWRMNNPRTTELRADILSPIFSNLTFKSAQKPFLNSGLKIEEHLTKRTKSDTSGVTISTNVQTRLHDFIWHMRSHALMGAVHQVGSRKMSFEMNWKIFLNSATPNVGQVSKSSANKDDLTPKVRSFRYKMSIEVHPRSIGQERIKYIWRLPIPMSKANAVEFENFMLILLYHSRHPMNKHFIIARHTIAKQTCDI